MKTTNYKGMTIIHPHSGKVSYSIVARCLKNYFGIEWKIPDYGTAIIVDINSKIYCERWSEFQK